MKTKTIRITNDVYNILLQEQAQLQKDTSQRVTLSETIEKLYDDMMAFDYELAYETRGKKEVKF